MIVRQRRFSQIIASLVVLLFTPITRAQTPESFTVGNDQLARNIAIATSAYRIKGPMSKRIAGPATIKWTGPVRISIQDHAGNDLNGDLERLTTLYLTKMREITNLDIRVVKTQDRTANFVIAIGTPHRLAPEFSQLHSDDPEFEPDLNVPFSGIFNHMVGPLKLGDAAFSDAVAECHVELNSRFNIIAAAIDFNLQRFATTDEYLGLLHDCGNYVFGFDRRRLMGEQDKDVDAVRALRLLYNPHISSGVSMEDANVAFQSILNGVPDAAKVSRPQ